MSRLQERINFAIQAFEKRHGKKFVDARMAADIGVGRSVVGQWRDGRTKEIKGINLLKAANYLEIDAEWLADDRSVLSSEAMKGKPRVRFSMINNKNAQICETAADYDPTATLSEILTKLQALDDKDQKLVFELINTLYEKLTRK